MKNNTFYIISPCVIVAAVLLLGIIKDNAQGGWSMLGVVAGLPLLFTVAVIGIITKLLIRKNNVLLWVVEMVLMVVSFVVLVKLGK
jgi:hypothetical protein